jgi:hypothetical protein
MCGSIRYDAAADTGQAEAFAGDLERLKQMILRFKPTRIANAPASNKLSKFCWWPVPTSVTLPVLAYL